MYCSLSCSERLSHFDIPALSIKFSQVGSFSLPTVINLSFLHIGIILLEGVEHPYNFGDALRSLYAAGATGLIVPERNWLSAAETVVKASAGASEYIPTAACPDLGEAIIEAKKYGIKTYCAERRDAVALYDADLTCPVIFAIGGELRGLSRKVTDNSDGNIYIPYGSNFRNALSASAASAVCAFEIMRQRQQKDVGN